MVTKIQDGSLVYATELLQTAVEDGDGNKLQFDPIPDAAIPSYRAEVVMNDGSGRKKVYAFGLADTLVRVGMTTISAEELKQNEKALKQQEQGQGQKETPSTNTTTASTEKAFKTTADTSSSSSSQPTTTKPTKTSELLDAETEPKSSTTSKKNK